MNYDYREQLLEELKYSYSQRAKKYDKEIANVIDKLEINSKRKEEKAKILAEAADVNRSFGNDANMNPKDAEFEYKHPPRGNKNKPESKTVDDKANESSYERRKKIAKDTLDKVQDGWIVLDTETTGLSDIDEVIEFGYVDSDGNKEAFLIELPEQPTNKKEGDKYIKGFKDRLKKNMLGIESDSVRRLSADQFSQLKAGNEIDGIPVISRKEAIKRINDLIRKDLKAVVAHNANFDVKMLERLGVDVEPITSENFVIDTSTLSRDYHESDNNTLKDYVEYTVGNDISKSDKQHTALYDSEQTAEAFKKTLEAMQDTVNDVEAEAQVNFDEVFNDDKGCGV